VPCRCPFCASAAAPARRERRGARASATRQQQA
jgi:hypothetical protein